MSETDGQGGAGHSGAVSEASTYLGTLYPSPSSSPNPALEVEAPPTYFLGSDRTDEAAFGAAFGAVSWLSCSVGNLSASTAVGRTILSLLSSNRRPVTCRQSTAQDKMKMKMKMVEVPRGCFSDLSQSRGAVRKATPLIPPPPPHTHTHTHTHHGHQRLTRRFFFFFGPMQALLHSPSSSK